MAASSSLSTDDLLAVLNATKSQGRILSAAKRVPESSPDTEEVLRTFKRVKLDRNTQEGPTGAGFTTPADVALSRESDVSEDEQTRHSAKTVFASKPRTYYCATPGMLSSSESDEEEGDTVPPTLEDAEYTPDQLGDDSGGGGEEDDERMDGGTEELPSGWELYKMNPVRLSQALHCLHYLKDRSWIDISSIDIWLMRVWGAASQPKARYIPSTFIPPTVLQADPTELQDEIGYFRALFDLPDREKPCPLETLVYVLNSGASRSRKGNHFCVVVMAPARQAIYLLGKDIHGTRSNNDSHDWESWNGTRIWSKACQLMGWADPPPMTLRTVDWSQNGYDCGPIACQVAQTIIVGGLKTDGLGQWKRPKMMECCHTLRLKMAELVHQSVMQGARNYSSVRARCGAGMQARFGTGLEGMDVVQAELVEDLQQSPVAQLHAVVRHLQQTIQKCRTCHAALEAERHRQAKHPIPLQKESIQQNAERHRHEALKGARPMSDHVAGEDLISSSKDDSTSDSSSLQDEISGGALGVSDRSEAKQIKGVDAKQARIGRFPRPRKGPTLPPRPHLRGLLLPFNRKFDDYEGGPVLEELAPIPDAYLQFHPSFMRVCRQMMLTPAPYASFKDYGYRLLPCFAQAFDLGKPILVKEHLCPVGLPKPPKSITDYACHKKYSRDGDEVLVNDVLVVGAKRLLEIAGEEGNDAILLTGQTIADRFVCVDLLQDHMEPDDLDFSCDFDSVIWITQNPKFKGPVHIYSLPVIRARAPIWKSNHVQIQVLHPQTEDDQCAIGGRSEWFTTAQSLSTIPHLLLGVVQGASLVEILLFFPRMMHKDPHQHFRVNRIPKGVQDFFWDQVLLPALGLVIPSTRLAYLPVDRPHSVFKMGMGKRTSTFSLDSTDLERLIKKMKKIVQTRQELKQFGSFFFVVQIKGSKGVAHAQKDSLKASMRESLRRFKQSLAGLDWAYMNDRQSGELICDVGVTVQPVRDDEPLVGLWRLDCLDASFGAGGYKSGSMHTLNTLSMFGGLQAESPAARKKRTHVAFRSSYNLAYEVTRKHDNARNLFDEKAVFSREPQFHAEIKAVQGIYEKAPRHSYGVRDEFRVGGGALEDVMECIGDAVTALMETGPILWIPSRTWFAFLSRRLKMLYEAHGKLWAKLPRNYGVTSGLFAFLMQSVIFTPPKVNWYVREALAALSYTGNCDRFGMFFIEMKDPSRPWLIDEIPEIDTRQIVRELKLTVRRPRKAQPERQEEEDATRYPLGEAPTWKQIAGCLRSDPTVLIPGWEAPAEVERYTSSEAGSVESQAAEVFVAFTCHLWILLNPTWRTRPENRISPTTLTDALRHWSVDSILEEVLGTSCKACHSGLDAGSGRPSLSFSERRKMYFPDDDPRSLSKAWKRLGESPGYIYKLRRLRRRLDHGANRLLDECLEELLDLCQCLPDSSRSQSGGWIWRVDQKKIAVLTNPKYYRLKRIGASTGGRQSTGLRAAPAHRSARSTAVAMMVHEDFPEELARRAYEATQRQKTKQGSRSAKSKNRRKPPQKKRGLSEDEDGDSSCDQEHCSDDDHEAGDEGSDDDHEAEDEGSSGDHEGSLGDEL